MRSLALFLLGGCCLAACSAKPRGTHAAASAAPAASTLPLDHLAEGELAPSKVEVYGFAVPRGMEIDLGGIGKEYAVDSAAGLVRSVSSRCLVNFGGDLLALGPQRDGSPWRVGVESVSNVGAVAKQIDLTVGAYPLSPTARTIPARTTARASCCGRSIT